MKSKLICAVLAFCMVFSTVVFAEDTAENNYFTNVNYDRENNTIEIVGRTENEGYARLLVAKSGTAFGDNASDTDIWTNTVYADEVKIAAADDADKSIVKGDFKFDAFSINDADSIAVETYVIRVALNDEIKEYTIYYASCEQAVNFLVNETDATALSSYISKYNDVYEFEVGTDSIYSTFSEEGKTWVLTKICNDNTVVDLETAQKAFTLYSSLWRVHKNNYTHVRDVIDNYSAKIGLSLTKYDLLTDSDVNSEKDDLAEKISGTLYQTLADFQNAIETQAQSIIDNRSSGSTGNGNSSSDRGSTPSFSPSFSSNSSTSVAQNQGTTAGFTDIDNHWAEDSIIMLSERGIVNGKGDNKFDPEGYVTRAEAIKMLILAFGNLDENASTDFSDVSADSWMYPYIATAASNGILNGYEDGTVGADKTVTRQDLCVMILRTARAFEIALENNGKEHSFTDAAEIADYADEAVTTLYNNGIISGFDDGTFGARLGTTRAQIAKMIAGFLEK